MNEVSRPWKPGDQSMYCALAGAQVVFFPLRRHLKLAFSVSLLAQDCLSRIQTILFYMETIGLTDADCKMGLAFGRSNKRADCMDDSGVHATRVEWPLRGSGKSLITFAVSFGIAAVEGGSSLRVWQMFQAALGRKRQLGVRSSAGSGQGSSSFAAGLFGRGVASERQKQQNFAENVTKCWRTAREGCILVPLSYCPESFLRRD